MPDIFEVRFEQVAQRGMRGRFSIPKAVVEIMGIGSSSNLIVEISSHKGSLSIVTNLKSGNEIYGELDEHFEPGELICVRVTRIGKNDRQQKSREV